METIWIATNSRRPATMRISLNGKVVSLSRTGHRLVTVQEPTEERAEATYEHWVRNAVRDHNNPLGWKRV